MLLRVLSHLFRPFTALKSLKIGQNAHFSAFRATQLCPLVAKTKNNAFGPCVLGKTPPPESFV